MRYSSTKCLLLNNTNGPRSIWFVWFFKHLLLLKCQQIPAGSTSGGGMWLRVPLDELELNSRMPGNCQRLGQYLDSPGGRFNLQWSVVQEISCCCWSRLIMQVTCAPKLVEFLPLKPSWRLSGWGRYPAAAPITVEQFLRLITRFTRERSGSKAFSE